MVRRGQESRCPDWYFNCPELGPGHDFYMRAFWALSTERQIGMNIGPIPDSRIESYGLRFGLDWDMMSVLRSVVRTMDRTYLTELAKKKQND